jgi:hypothetical protein
MGKMFKKGINKGVESLRACVRKSVNTYLRVCSASRPAGVRVAPESIILA